MDEEQMAELGLSIEDRNFYRDHRVSTVKVAIPRNPKTKWHFIICTVCNGKGKHVNPSIDASGLTHEDFAEDPDFAEDYMSGMYDVGCTKCHSGKMVRITDDHEQDYEYEEGDQPPEPSEDFDDEVESSEDFDEDDDAELQNEYDPRNED
jgi:hypothetical protein